jgi:DNA repair exonuclease SbcCD ATPase subunit
MVAATLGAGTFESEIEACHSDEVIRFRVEREIGSEPRLYRDGVRELTDSSLLRCIEIYSQSDLQVLAEDDEQRLRLIDKANSRQILGYQQRRSKFLTQLKEVGLELRQIRSVIQTLETKLREAPSIETQLADLRANRPTISTELDTARRRFLARGSAERVFTQAAEAVQKLASPLDQVESIRVQVAQAAAELASNVDVDTNSIVAALQPVIDGLGTAATSLQRALESDFRRSVGVFLAASSDIETTYRKLQQEEQIVNEALRQEDQLEKQHAHLQRIKVELGAAKEKERAHSDIRNKLRQKVSDVDSAIFELRMSQVELINADAVGEIYVRLEPGAQAEPYIERLSELLAGSRIQNQRGVAEEIAETFSAAEFIDLVESGNAKQLAGALKRDLGQMTRVVAHLADHEELYSLETEAAEDRLDITMVVDGVAKPIETLSKGQKATALLPLVLRSSPYPLIMDQPEDDLDNSFVFDFLVQTIEQLKTNRQIIFVTHNANIPVLGGADQVVVMRMETPEVAAEPLTGTVDERSKEILNLLEGGARAFELRRAKYKAFLAS